MRPVRGPPSHGHCVDCLVSAAPTTNFAPPSHFHRAGCGGGALVNADGGSNATLYGADLDPRASFSASRMVLRGANSGLLGLPQPRLCTSPAPRDRALPAFSLTVGQRPPLCHHPLLHHPVILSVLPAAIPQTAELQPTIVTISGTSLASFRWTFAQIAFWQTSDGTFRLLPISARTPH